MDNDTFILVTLGTIAVVYQAFVTLLVVRCKFFVSRQRAIQCVLIWLVPVIGALICHAVVHSHKSTGSTDDSLVKHYEGEDDYFWPRSSRSYSNSAHTSESDSEGDT